MKKFLLLSASFLFSVYGLVAQSNGVSINSSGTPPDPSAMLDVSGTSKGVLINRMSTAQRDAISNPAVGLMVFNTTTNCLNMWNGNSWKQSCFDCDFTSPTAGNNGPLCEGSTLNLTATTISGATYQWSGPNGFTSSLQNPSISNATPGASGSYSVTATVNGCTSQPQTTVATVNTNPSAPTAGNDGPACVGGILNLTASTIAGATYAWTGPNGYSASVQNPTIGSAQLTNAGTYNVIATVNGCSGSAGQTSVTINSAPATPGSITGSQSVCASSSGNVYSISAVAGATSYNWTVPSGATITGNTGTSITVTMGSSSGNVSVTASNTCGTSGSSSLDITVNSGGSGSQSFNYTGAPQTFTVPACVSTVNIQAYGAQGYTAGFPGGRGGSASGNYATSPGQTLYVYVGGQGTNSSGANVIMGGGWNGGGHGMNNSTGPYCGGGGGASDVRTVFSANPVDGTSLASRIIVAGGGGGATSNGGCFGGDGGGSVGATGGYCCGGSAPTGGTQSAGGNLGGGLGQGGNATSGLTPWIGGGGGGYYGGGTSDAHSGGGGGSSFIGGVSGGSTVIGVRSGDGTVTISW